VEQGYIHLYCGDGKGKTTAAVGLAVRAAGAGKRVLFVQFMKGRKSSELNSLKMLSHIEILRGEKAFPFYHQMTEAEKAEQTMLHNQLLAEIEKRFQEKKIEVLILDEVTYPYQWKLMDCEKLCAFFAMAKGKIEIVCTGRNPDAFFVNAADYITEMKCNRHPYEKGVAARKGIEY
jgi:cob(I)alamin adenosyltransferase